MQFQDRYRDSVYRAGRFDQEGWEVVRPFIDNRGSVFVGDRDFGDEITFIVDRTGKIEALL